MTEKKAKANVWCRDCGKEMKQAPYEILAFYCEDCELKATVTYEPTPKYTYSDFEKGRPIK